MRETDKRMDQRIHETDSTLTVDDVRDQCERLSRFVRCFPKFADMRLCGGVAGLSFDCEADKFAYRQDLYVLTLSGEGFVVVLNDDKFQHKTW